MSEFSLVIAIGYWKSDKQARHVRQRCIDSFKHIFLRAIYMYCSGQLIHCLKIAGKKEQFEAEIAKKLRKAQPEPKVTGSYKKKSVYTDRATRRSCSEMNNCEIWVSVYISKILILI